MTRRLLVRGHAGVFGPGRPVAQPCVLVAGGVVEWIGPATAAPDADVGEELAGPWYLVPGAVDHHVHIGLSDPAAVLRGGVTRCRDLAWPEDEIFELARASQAASFDGPRIVAVGPMLTAPGGYPTRSAWAPAGTGLEIRGRARAAAAVERLAGRGVPAIKVALNSDQGPTLRDDELAAIVAAAREHGLGVVAHVEGAGQAERALRAGVGELAHTPWTERLSDDVVAALAGRVTIVSTLDIHGHGERTDDVERALDNLRRFLAAGGRVRYGTDLGNGPITPGVHVEELRLLEAAGLSRRAVVDLLRAEPLGPGGEVDLLALGADPLEDLGAFADVRLVLRAGRRVASAGAAG